MEFSVVYLRSRTSHLLHKHHCSDEKGRWAVCACVTSFVCLWERNRWRMCGDLAWTYWYWCPNPTLVQICFYPRKHSRSISNPRKKRGTGNPAPPKPNLHLLLLPASACCSAAAQKQQALSGEILNSALRSASYDIFIWGNIFIWGHIPCTCNFLMQFHQLIVVASCRHSLVPPFPTTALSFNLDWNAMLNKRAQNKFIQLFVCLFFRFTFDHVNAFLCSDKTN